jgi:caffeoyl-CoA O-methyltransferase
MELVNALAEQYALHHTSKLDALCAEVLEFTEKNHSEPHMISGATQGVFLELISKLKQPLNILEIGTFTGFSALCLAKGLAPNGHLHTIELRENDAQIAQGFFEKSQFKNQIHIHVGDAKKIVPTLVLEWDLVFIDADKVSYCEYYDLTLPRLKNGGIIIADNVLFHGQVLQHPVKGKSAKAIEAFNEKIKNDPNVHHLMLTLRDGLMLIIKN